MTTPTDLEGRRGVAGFPRGSTHDIERLSCAPSYCAYPSPFISRFVASLEHRRLEPPTSTPYVGDLRPRGRHPVYVFHGYHTKVPPEVVRTLIEHYSRPGELVLDPFCGSGMTGVAARECGRHALLFDLSPVSTFISAVNTTTHRVDEVVATMRSIIEASRREHAWLYETRQPDGQRLEVRHFVWSDVFACRSCGFKFPFFPHGVVDHGDKVSTKDAFGCPGCAASLTIRRIDRVVADGQKQKALGFLSAGPSRRPIRRAPHDFDIELAARVETLPVATWFPRDAVDPNGYSARLAQLGDKLVRDVSMFLSRRNLIVFSDLWQRSSTVTNAETRNAVRATLTSIFNVISERQGYFGGGGGMSGNFYMPVVRQEKNVYLVLERKLRGFVRAEATKPAAERARVLVSTQSATDLRAVPDGSVDYIYVDPPFGSNIIYSEMNQVLEAWLRVKTAAGEEAVIDKSRGLDLDGYADRLRRAFAELYRVLKPGRWMTVEFHNTNPAVWTAIQRAIGAAGFVVEQVGVLDKGSTTILGDIRPDAAKHDLLITAVKTCHAAAMAPRRGFALEVAEEASVWTFMDSHLARLPIHYDAAGALVRVPERERHFLFDRVVALHVRRGAAVPLSSAAFNRGLERRYQQRDGMWFLPGSVSSP